VKTSGSAGHATCVKPVASAASYQMTIVTLVSGCRNAYAGHGARAMAGRTGWVDDVTPG